MKLMVLSSAVWGSVFIKENMTTGETNKSGGLNIINGKLGSHRFALVEQEDGFESDLAEVISNEIKPDCILSLGEAYSSKKNLENGDLVMSSAAAYIVPGNSNQLEEVKADLFMVDLGLKAAEKFNGEEKLCKVVVGKVFLNPGTVKTGLKLTFLPHNDIYCMDNNGYPLIQGAVTTGLPFVLVRTIVPVKNRQQKEIAHNKWDMAKKNFWVLKGILEGLKKSLPAEKRGKLT
jgi:nucleoside phosphorylase